MTDDLEDLLADVVADPDNTVAETTPKRKALTPEQRAVKNAKDKERRAKTKAPKMPDFTEAAKDLQAKLAAVDKPKPPKHDLAKQVEKLGADSLLPPKAKAKAPKQIDAAAETRRVMIAAVDKPKPQRKAVTTKKVAAKAKPPKRKAVADGITVVMKRTYVREGKVADGTEVRGGARQLAIMFPPKLFAKIARHARSNGLSFSEQVRQCVVAHLS